MVKKLRRKFVLTAMLSLLVILATIISVINITNYGQIQQGADETLNILAYNDGQFPDMGKIFEEKAREEGKDTLQQPPEEMFFMDKMEYNRSIEMPYMSRYFFVRLSNDGKVTDVDTGHIAAISSDDAAGFATQIFNSGKTKGYIDNHYRYLVHENDDGTYMILFIDCGSSFFEANKLFKMTLLIGIVALMAMFALVYLFSGKAVAPVVESLEKQKRFITDAGHELKTPLAVISANVDVIELEAGKSEWTSSIKGQIGRMNGLVKDMLTLSRMDEENHQFVFSEIDISSIVKSSAESFQAVAESGGLKFEQKIENGINIMGDKNSIAQLASILLDNAMKYASENGEVTALLKTDTKKKRVVFEVKNTCDAIPEGNLDKLFDRFYRADSSRSRETGGYGIGLSVARAIVTSHGGTIEAKKEGDKAIRFIAKLPMK